MLTDYVNIGELAARPNQPRNAEEQVPRPKNTAGSRDTDDNLDGGTGGEL